MTRTVRDLVAGSGIVFEDRGEQRSRASPTAGRSTPPGARHRGRAHENLVQFARMQFDRHTLVLLVRRPDAPELTDQEAAELQDRHLAFRADLRDRGYLIGGGPLVDQDDERLRGISIMTCDPETAQGQQRGPGGAGGPARDRGDDLDGSRGNVRFENVPAPR